MNGVDFIPSWDKSQNMTRCSCWILINPKETSLHPGVVTEIIIPFEGPAPVNVLQVKNHMCNKPWRVINEYVYFNQRTHSLIIPVITSFLRILEAGEPICHIEVMHPFTTLQKIKGKI